MTSSRIGSIIVGGRYRLKTVMGEGALGVLYEATRVREGMRVDPSVEAKP